MLPRKVVYNYSSPNLFYSTTNTILQHEALRTKTREALNSDSLFMSLVADCQQSASLRETEIQVMGSSIRCLYVLMYQILIFMSQNPY